MSYYDRTEATHLDGSPIFATRGDEDSERQVASVLEQAWGVELHRFGKLCAIDWWALRSGRLAGVLELKTRSHASTKYPTVYLNVRKWLALTLAANGLGCPAIYVVRFEDGIFWTPVNEIDASQVTIGGCVRQVKSRSDVEPVIEVPIGKMTLAA